MRSTNSNSKNERPNNRNRPRETRMRIGNSHKKAQKFLYLLCLFVAFSWLRVGTIAVRAQIKYARGQNVAPALKDGNRIPTEATTSCSVISTAITRRKSIFPSVRTTISSRVGTEASRLIFILGGSDSYSE